MAFLPLLATGGVIPALAGGALAGGALSGGKKGGSPDNSAANAQAALSQQLFTQTDPLRRSLINRSENFLGVPQGPQGSIAASGGKGDVASGVLNGLVTNDPQPNSFGTGGDVRNTPTYLAFKSGADKTFQRARDNVLSKVPGGGGLTQALTQLEGDRASSLTQGAGQIYQDELSRALSLATGTAPTALNGLGQAAAIQSANANAAADRNSQKTGDLGAGIGMLLGGK